MLIGEKEREMENTETAGQCQRVISPRMEITTKTKTSHDVRTTGIALVEVVSLLDPPITEGQLPHPVHCQTGDEISAQLVEKGNRCAEQRSKWPTPRWPNESKL